MVTKPLVLLTGATGFVGSSILVELIKHYRVRCSYRSELSKNDLLAAATTPTLASRVDAGDLTFVTVPNIAVLDAYNAAVKDCDYVIHCASPTPGHSDNLLRDAVNGTTSILHAAAKTSSVKRVVITASVVSLTRPGERYPSDPYNVAIAQGRLGDIDTLNSTRFLPDPEPLPEDASPLAQYDVSKCAALNAVRRFAASPDGRAAPFDTVTLCPGFILGPRVLSHNRATALEGSNIILSWLFNKDFALNQMMHLPAGEDAPTMSVFTHLDDVVEGHVKALTLPMRPGENFRNFLLLSDGPTGPQVVPDALRALKEHAPAVAAQCPAEGSVGTLPMNFDCADTERDLLGHKMKGYAAQVVDTMSWYVGLPA